MNPRTIEVGWEHEVPVDEVRQFRDTRTEELEAHYGVPVQQLTDMDVAKYMVRISHPSPRYLKPGLTGLVLSR
ncbi:MAG: hypothetical protein ACOY93_07560 [Bacillota bacterium]